MSDIITISFGNLMTAFDDEVVKAVQQVGIDADKEELFYEWCESEGVANKPNSMIVFLMEKGWLNEKKVIEDLADTPQTEVGYCNECRWFKDKQVCGRCRSRNLFAKADTPQTDVYDYKGSGKWERSE